MNLSAEQLHAALKELQERLNAPLESMRPVLIELKDPAPRQTRSKNAGLVTRAAFDITSDTYAWLLETIPEQATLKCLVWLEDAPENAPQPAKTKKKQAKVEGDWGQFWKDMFLEMVIGSADFKMTFPGLQKGLDRWSKVVGAQFNPPENTSLNTVSPQMLIAHITEVWKDTEKQGIVERLTVKINEVAGMSTKRPPADQYFSPADILGISAQPLKTIRKSEVLAQDDDQKFLEDNLLP